MSVCMYEYILITYLQKSEIVWIGVVYQHLQRDVEEIHTLDIATELHLRQIYKVIFIYFTITFIYSPWRTSVIQYCGAFSVLRGMSSVSRGETIKTLEEVV